MTPDNLDLIAGWVSLVLTLMVFSYLLGDNVLYRVALHVLVGVTAAFVAIVAVESVLIPWFDQTVLIDTTDRSTATVATLRVAGLIPVLIGALLLLKNSSRLTVFGNIGLALVIGVGTAVALMGAAAGTVAALSDDVRDTVAEDLTEGAIILAGVVSTLVYFQYVAVERGGEVRRGRVAQTLGSAGRLFITVTLGALYGGAIITSLTIFSDVVRVQLQFILDKVGG